MPTFLNVNFKLNLPCDHLVRTFVAANLFARYYSYLSSLSNGCIKNNLARAKVALVDFKSLRQISSLRSLTKT